jgi:cytochrome P450
MTLTVERQCVVGTSRDEIDADAFGFLARLRRESPVAYVPAYNSWVITKWEHVHAVLKTPENFRSKPTYLYRPAVGGEYVSTVGDGETHQCLRKGLDASLAPRAVEAWADDIIDPVVEEQLSLIEGRGQGDLLEDLLGPISLHVLANAMGIPDVPREELYGWYEGIAKGFFNSNADPAQQDRSWALSDQIDIHFRPLMQAKWDEPDNSMMSHLLQNGFGESFGERFTFVMPTLKAVIFAGSQEPAHGAVNTLIGILGEEEARERMAADPHGLVEQAAEEGLRWNPPLLSFLRRVLNTTEVEGVTLPAGDEMMVSMGSANRDEDVWGPDADKYDLDRFAPGSDARHVSFGLHPHFCPGSYLVRSTIRRSLPSIFERLPNLRIDPAHPPRIGQGLLINAPHLHCLWDPA